MPYFHFPACRLSSLSGVRSASNGGGMAGARAICALVVVLGVAAAAGRPYAEPSYALAVEQLQQLARAHPDLVSVTTAQSAFGLATAGTCKVSGTRAPCLNWIVHVTNRRTLPDVERPEILFLGALHGDERIGTVSTIELARFLASSHGTNAWVRRLVDTTSIWIVPMPNAVGYEENKRLELGLFPNRDFGYVQKPEKCMTTIAGRTVNELFREHAFRIAVTFHGGMTSIGYPWGSFNHHRNGPRQAPDDAALHDIARALSNYASTGGVDKKYPFGTMNDQVYPVYGGMEDWGYAASFDPQNAVRCRPTSHGGYDAGRAAPSNASARALVFLVEAGPKHPRASTLGAEGDTLRPGAPGDGHVPRNIRLALAAIDFLQPHVEVLHPPSRASARVLDAAVGEPVRLAWRVWGAARVDAAELVWRARGEHSWQAVAGARSQSGFGVWGDSGTPEKGRAGVYELCLAPAAEGAVQVALRVRADAHWGRNGGRRIAPAGMPPQSHLSRARTDPAWDMRNQQSRVRGRVHWLSEPVELRAGGGSTHAVPPRIAECARGLAAVRAPAASGAPRTARSSPASSIMPFMMPSRTPRRKPRKRIGDTREGVQ